MISGESDMDEEKEALQLEIRKLGTMPMKLRENISPRIQNKLVKESGLECYLNRG